MQPIMQLVALLASCVIGTSLENERSLEAAALSYHEVFPLRVECGGMGQAENPFFPNDRNANIVEHHARVFEIENFNRIEVRPCTLYISNRAEYNLYLYTRANKLGRKLGSTFFDGLRCVKAAPRGA